MKRLSSLILSIVFAGLWATAVSQNSLTPPAAVGFTAVSQDDPLFLGNGQALGNANSHGVALGDFNGDGFVDAFVANGNGPAPNRVWLNDGAGLFYSNGQSLGDRDSQAVALGDLNGNGYLDAVVANSDGLNQVWLNDGSDHFTAGQTFEASVSRDVALGDLNGNGHLDVIFANSFANKVWFNNGDGTFEDSDQLLGTANSYGVALADLNGNGHLDAVFANHGPDAVWFNNGFGIFSEQQTLGDGWSYGLALGDLNGNGYSDAFVASWFPHANLVWFNDGSGGFIDSGQVLGEAGSLGVALADVNGNGRLDAIVANNFPHGIQVWLNDGAGDFSQSGQSLEGTTTYAVALADLDGDGDLDIFAANFGPNQVWLNQSAASPPAHGADLALVISGARYVQAPVFNTPATYMDVTVHNLGPEAATAVTVRDVNGSAILPGIFSQGSQGQCLHSTCEEAWLFGDLAPGESAYVRFQPRDARLLFGHGVVHSQNRAIVAVDSLEPDPLLDNNRATFTTYYFDCDFAECLLENLFCRFSLPSSAGQLRVLAETAVDLAVYYLVRDVVLRSSAAGQRYVDLYDAHQSEIDALLETDASLEAEGIATLQLWEDNLWALVTGKGNEALITAEQVAAVDSFLTNLWAVASPELQQVIAEERNLLGPPEDYVGMTMTEARGVVIGYSLKLPLIRRD
jgi:hypothetical protein